jgi:hypothetical protein
MIRRFAMGLLLVGAVSGYAQGFRSMARWREHRAAQRRAMVEQLARTCAEAAVRAQDARGATNAARPLSATASTSTSATSAAAPR